MNISGMIRRGESNPTSKMTDEVVVAARQLYTEGMSIEELARQAGVGLSTMHKCLIGHSWRHLPGPVKLRTRKYVRREARP